MFQHILFIIFILINNESLRSISTSSDDVGDVSTSYDDADMLRKASLFIKINNLWFNVLCSDLSLIDQWRIIFFFFLFNNLLTQQLDMKKLSFLIVLT